MKPTYLSPILALAIALTHTSCENKKNTNTTSPEATLLAPASFIVLPDKFNSPDGLTIGPDGRLYVAINNVSDQSHPAKIGVIDSNDTVSVFADLPAHPVTGKVSPLGIVFGSDGNLYVADNQSFVTEEPGHSRLLRVNIKDGKPVGTDVVVTGMTMANGVSAHGDYVVVNDTAIDKTYPLKSGTYRFKLSELKGEPIQVQGLEDSHLVAQIKTMNKEHQVGANGVAYDKSGNLYICNFGDSEIWKASFDADGSVTSVKLFCTCKELDSVDGLQIDSEGNLWTADFLGNAIARIHTDDGTTELIAKNKPGTGAEGTLDAPSECIRFGNKVYVSNIDLTYGPNQADQLHTISIFELSEKK